MRALASLPIGQRRVVVLRYFVGLSVEETAADLGCSTGNVKSQTSHGLRKLDGAAVTTVQRTEGVRRR